jgi:phosphoglycerate kinase
VTGEGNGEGTGGLRRLSDLTVADLRGRRALVRVDYNVPLDDRAEVADPGRVTATFPTLRRLLDAGARPVLLSHLGRPGGRPDPDLSLAPVARVLEAGLGRTVRFVGPPDGDEAVRATREAESGTVLLAENVRFLPGETKNDPELARRLARLGDLYVNDAFGACHRAHASTVGVARLLRPAVAGLLVERELEALGALRAEPGRPYLVAFGGAKISDKISLLEGMLERADGLLVGGAMANTFLRAQGQETGRSLVEEGALDDARALLEAAGDRILLPEDLVVAPDADAGKEAGIVPADEIPADASALDVGPRTREQFAAEIAEAATFFWNGPMGLFEREAFAEGTRAVARAAAEAARQGTFVVVGGGDSARAVREAGVADALSHVSTGGGAALEYLEKGTLPALEALEVA